mmetsp:Transcript_7554/g.24819  ORF Transcript_7554/g.24819 Transcript_7554/m.24819 type:complete len:227 (+) Transcript_7554:651-1331(+)
MRMRATGHAIGALSRRPRPRAGVPPAAHRSTDLRTCSLMNELSELSCNMLGTDPEPRTESRSGCWCGVAARTDTRSSQPCLCMAPYGGPRANWEKKDAGEVRMAAASDVGPNKPPTPPVAAPWECQACGDSSHLHSTADLAARILGQRGRGLRGAQTVAVLAAGGRSSTSDSVPSSLPFSTAGTATPRSARQRTGRKQRCGSDGALAGASFADTFNGRAGSPAASA